MPQLKQLSCCIQWSDTNAPFQEYGTAYGDGVVESFIIVPNKPQSFCIRLVSRGFIYEGLSMVVYIDGNYQCNRSRVNLKPPKRGQASKASEIDFLLRQKEKPYGDGVYMGREWRFDSHNIVAEPQSGFKQSHFDDLGTIEVLVLRCRATNSKDAEYEGSSSGEDSDIFCDNPDRADELATEQIEDAKPDPAPAEAVSEPTVEAFSMVGIFDGANDYEPCQYDGGYGGKGSWIWRQGQEPSAEDFHSIHRMQHSEQHIPDRRFHTSSYIQHGYRNSHNGPHHQRAFAGPPPPKHVHFDYGPFPPPPAPHYRETWEQHEHPEPREPPSSKRIPLERPSSSERSRPFEPRRSGGERHPSGSPYEPQQVNTGPANHYWARQQPYQTLDYQYHYNWPPQWLENTHFKKEGASNVDFSSQNQGQSSQTMPEKHPPNDGITPNATKVEMQLKREPPVEGDTSNSRTNQYSNYVMHHQQSPYYPYYGLLSMPQPHYPQVFQLGYLPKHPYAQHACYYPSMAASGYPGMEEQISPKTSTAGGQLYSEHENRQDGGGGGGGDGHGHDDKKNDDGWGNQNDENQQTSNNASWDNQDNQNTYINAGNGNWNSSDNKSDNNSVNGNWNLDQGGNDGGGCNEDGYNNRDDNNASADCSNDWSGDNNISTGNNNLVADKVRAASPEIGRVLDAPRDLYGPHGPYISLRALRIDEPQPDAEEEPRYDVPKSIAAARGSTKQVQPGPGYRYFKKRTIPEYIDTMEAPYARFVFKYRTKEQLMNEIGIEVDVEPSSDQEIQSLQNMDKQALIEMLMRAKSALGGKVPSPSAAPSTPGKDGEGGIPIALDAPNRSHLNYTLPPLRSMPIARRTAPSQYLDSSKYSDATKENNRNAVAQNDGGKAVLNDHSNSNGSDSRRNGVNWDGASARVSAQSALQQQNKRPSPAAAAPQSQQDFQGTAVTSSAKGGNWNLLQDIPPKPPTPLGWNNVSDSKPVRGSNRAYKTTENWDTACNQGAIDW